MSNTKSVSITIRMDESLKRNFEKVLDDIGLSVSSAFTVFAKAVTKEHKIPFALVADPFYSETNLKILEKSIKELDEGHYIVKTLDELKEMEK